MTMDIAQIAANAMALVGPILTNVIIEETSKAVLHKLWRKIRDGVAPENETRVIQLLRQLEKHPGDIRLRAELEARLAARLSADPDFRHELARLVEEAGGWTAVRQGTPTPPPAALHQLPADIADFTGRARELAILLEGAKQAGTAPPILVLTGTGGSGKSALAVHAAHLLRERFPDIQLYEDLQGAGGPPKNPEVVLDGFLRALGVEERMLLRMDRDAKARLYRSLLMEKRALVLLDDAREEAQVRPLLPGSPSCLVLVTSRWSLSTLEGKTVDLRLAMLEEADALNLLERLIGRQRFASDPMNARRIVHLCGCLPLAVRVAGGRLKTSGEELHTYATRLEKEQGRLRKLNQSDLDVWTSFMVSYRHLNPPEARLFRLLGLFPGESFTSEAAVALAVPDRNILRDGLHRLRGSRRIEPEAVPALLDRLVDMQLLEPIGGGRYSFHDLIRLFARECLTDERPGAQDSARLRVARWYVGKSREVNDWLVPEKAVKKLEELAAQMNLSAAEVSRSESLKALTWFEMERANLAAAVEWAHKGRQWKVTWELAQNIANFYNIRCHWAEWEHTHALALDATRRGRSQDNEAIILNLLGNVYRLQGRWEKSREMLEAALSLHRKLNNLTGESIALNLLANLYRLQGRWDEAIAAFEEGLEINRRSKNRFGESIALGGLGNVYRMQGRWEEALGVYEESLRISDERKDPRGRCISLNNIGLVYSRLGRLAEAEDVLQESLSICEQMKFPRGRCIALRTLGEVRMLQNRWDEALELLTESLKIARQQTDQRCICQALTSLGRWYTQQQRWEEASRCFEEARASLCEMGDVHGEGLVLKEKGLLLAAQNRGEEAALLWREALGKLNSSSPESNEVKEQLLNQPN